MRKAVLNRLGFIHSGGNVIFSSRAFVFFSFFCAFSFFMSVGEARADLAWCDSIRNTPQYQNQFLAPLVACFTDPTNGLVPQATRSFMTLLSAYYVPAVSAMAIFLVSWFGLKLMTGDVQNFKGDGLILVFKIAGVFYFMEQAPTLYTYLLQMMAEFSNIVGQVVTDAGPGVFCSKATLWQSIDCVFAFVLISGGVGLVSILLIILLTAGTGIVLLFAFLYLIVGIFFAIARFVQIYIMSVVAISFMFALGYMFVPLLFFRNTFRYFQQWLAICLGYLLIPVIMFGYMAMMYVAIDDTIISGKYSILREIFGTAAVNAMNPDNPNSNPSTQVQCPTGGNDTGKYCNRHYSKALDVGCSNDNAQKVQTNVGISGPMQDPGVPGVQHNSTYDPSCMPIGFDYMEADISMMAYLQGDGKTDEQYLTDIMLSIIVAALLAYVMIGLMSFIPDLASGLVSQGTSAGRTVVKAEVFGEAVVRGTLDLAKEAAMAFATGGASAAQTAGKMAAQQAAKQVAQRAAPK